MAVDGVDMTGEIWSSGRETKAEVVEEEEGRKTEVNCAERVSHQHEARSEGENCPSRWTRLRTALVRSVQRA